MEILISTSTSKPIYEQITSQIKAQIMSGALQPGRRSLHARWPSPSTSASSRCKRPTRTARTASSKRRWGADPLSPTNRDFIRRSSSARRRAPAARSGHRPHERDSAGDAPQNSDDVLSGRRMNMEAILQVEHLDKALPGLYAGRRLLLPAQGRGHGLIGENGAGKEHHHPRPARPHPPGRGKCDLLGAGAFASQAPAGTSAWCWTA